MWLQLQSNPRAECGTEYAFCVRRWIEVQNWFKCLLNWQQTGFFNLYSTFMCGSADGGAAQKVAPQKLNISSTFSPLFLATSAALRRVIDIWNFVPFVDFGGGR